MSIVLWVLQVALAFLCISGGAYQIFKLDELKMGVGAMRALPRGLWMFLGALGCASGLTLLVPGVTNLTAIAAGVIAAQSLLICAFYVRFRDTSPLPYSVVMVLFAVVICYGRLKLQPL